MPNAPQLAPKAYSYTRFSTPEQAKGDSARRQIAAAEAWAAERNMELDDRLRLSDAGVSAYRGKNAAEGALKGFLEHCEHGLVAPGSYLLIESLDRLSRQDPWDTVALNRLVPASGVQRYVEFADDGIMREAASISDGFLRASIGADALPAKRDGLLGRPMTLSGPGRLLGIKGGPGADEADDPLLVELERLSFDLPRPRRSQLGVRLSAPQFSRWLELKGQLVRNEETGLTLEETLTELIQLPEYQDANRNMRIELIRAEMEGFPSHVQVRTLDHEGALWVSFTDLAGAATERPRDIERQLIAIKALPRTIGAYRERESRRPGWVNLRLIPMETVKALKLTPAPPKPPPVVFYPVAQPVAPIAPPRPSPEPPTAGTPVPCERCAALEAENKRLRDAVAEIEGFARSILVW